MEITLNNKAMDLMYSRVRVTREDGVLEDLKFSGTDRSREAERKPGIESGGQQLSSLLSYLNLKRHPRASVLSYRSRSF